VYVRDADCAEVKIVIEQKLSLGRLPAASTWLGQAVYPAIAVMVRALLRGATRGEVGSFILNATT